MRPSVVSASKSGAVSPSCSPIPSSSHCATGWSRPVIEQRRIARRTAAATRALRSHGGSADGSSSGSGGLLALAPQPGDGRLQAARIVHARLPAEHLSRSAIAEILVVAKHLHGLTREQRRLSLIH